MKRFVALVAVTMLVAVAGTMLTPKSPQSRRRRERCWRE